jgi:hypothetical protein
MRRTAALQVARQAAAGGVCAISIAFTPGGST